VLKSLLQNSADDPLCKISPTIASSDFPKELPP
jgi:hypothetical protein